MGYKTKPKKSSARELLKSAKAAKSLTSARRYAAQYIAEHGIAQFIDVHTEWPAGCGAEFVESYSIDRATGEFNTLGAFKHEGLLIFIHIVARDPYEISEREYYGYQDEIWEDDDEEDQIGPDQFTVRLHKPAIELDVVPWEIKYSRTGKAPRQNS